MSKSNKDIRESIARPTQNNALHINSSQQRAESNARRPSRVSNGSVSKVVEKTKRRVPKSLRDQHVRTKSISRFSSEQEDLENTNLSSGSDGGSDIKIGSQEFRRSHPRKSSVLTVTTAAGSLETTSTSLSLSSDSLDSSIHKFRDDFDDFKCKMRIFGESLNLCKCIANDFKGRLTYMESKLQGLEKRQKHIKTQSNYTAIIKKNKELETKTKAYIAKLQKCGTEEEMREVVGRICKNYLHGFWKVVRPQELKFRKVSGGLSNYIYVIGLPDDPKPLFTRLNEMEEDDAKAIKTAIETGDEPKQVLLRIYGQVHGERAMDAIVTESVIFTLLSERRLGPKLYGVFSGGRIEEYIPARPLLTKELSEPAISMKIAEKTAAIHSMDIPLSKEPNFIWKSMCRWLKTVKEECFNNGIKGKNEVEQNAIKRLKEMNFDNEIEWLKKYLLTFESMVVFCHNDLQEGNILLLEEEPTNVCDEYETEYIRNYSCEQEQALTGTKEDISRCGFDDQPDDFAIDATEACSKVFGPQSDLLQARVGFSAEEEEDTALSEPPGEPKLFLIDFEYCAYNYRAFDIANHFCEWSYDYTNPEYPFYFERQDPPTLEQKEIFIREYLKFYNANLSEDKQPVDPDIDAVNKLLTEVEAFALASHLFWTLWSIVNASKSQIPFGYWEYSVARLDQYLRLKQEVIKKEQYGLPHKRKIEEVDI